jgi:ATP-binding cassette subfamily B protein
MKNKIAILSFIFLALAGWDRISEILSLDPDLAVISNEVSASNGSLLEFRNVIFRYPDGKEVLHNINFKLEKGKTYALVGPTGGGKSTTASLMARLYDPTEGEVFLNGRDIRSYEANERTKKIGFILQDPFLFTGTVRENILYGNDEFQNHSNDELGNLLKKMNLEKSLQKVKQNSQLKKDCFEQFSENKHEKFEIHHFESPMESVEQSYQYKCLIVKKAMNLKLEHKRKSLLRLHNSVTS